jgi:hypothetical protein
MKIHHIGIASKKLDTALESLMLEQSDIVEEIYDDLQGNVLYFLRKTQQEPIIELVIPFRNNSTVSNFTKKNITGLHHIGFGTTSLKSSVDKHKLLKGHFLLKQYEITVKSFGGKVKTAFIYANGMLIEYIENV